MILNAETNRNILLQMLANNSDKVYLTVSGIAVDVKKLAEVI